MLTRRHIRVKVMQSIYALHQHENHNLQKEEKFLLKSIDDTYALYATLMALWKQLYERAEELLEISQKKYLVSEQEKLKNQKFVSNKALLLLVENEALNGFISENCMINWNLHSEYVGLIYKQILESKTYQTYVASEKNDFNSDKFLLVDLFKDIIAVDEKLYDFLQDGAMTWQDDLPIVNTFIVKLLKEIQPKSDSSVFVSKLKPSSNDKDFSIELLRKAVLNDEKYHEILKDKTQKWDINRLAQLDTILIKMAITEFLKFASIPVKATLNEYVEIAKEYSTPKSSVFINGILDNISKDFQEKGLLNKIGRGLI